MFVKLIKANFKEMFMDKTYLFWFLLFPVIFVAVFGLLFSNPGKESAGGMIYEVGLASNAAAPLSEDLKARFSRAGKDAGTFNLHTGAAAAEKEAFKNGRRHALLLLPGTFAQNLRQNKPMTIDLYFDVHHTGVLYPVGEAVDTVEKSIEGSSKLLRFNIIPSAQFREKSQDPAAAKQTKKKVLRLNQLDFMLSGVLALSLMQFGLFGSLRVLNLRAQGTLRLLATTPMPRTVFLASEITVRLIWSLLQGILILLLSHYIFNLTLTGNWFAIAGWMALGTCSFIAMGYMLTSFTKTPDGGNALFQVVQFPMMLLAGIFIPVDMMPAFIRPVVNFMPLAYLADGLRASMTGIKSVYGTGVNLTVLTGILIVSLVTATARFKWE